MPLIPKDRPDWLELFQQQMDQLFHFLMSLEGKGRFGERDFAPLVDIYETSDSFIVEIELPGFDRKDLSLKTFHHVLVVEGIKHHDAPDREVRYICMERNFGRFCRAVEIPPTVDIGRVKARCERGILSVAFPKVADTSTIIKEIPIE